MLTKEWRKILTKAEMPFMRQMLHSRQIIRAKSKPAAVATEECIDLRNC